MGGRARQLDMLSYQLAELAVQTWPACTTVLMAAESTHSRSDRRCWPPLQV